MHESYFSRHLFTLNGLLRWSWQSSGPGVSALSLAHSGSALLCGFDDGAIRVWRLHDRALLANYVPAPAPVLCIAPAEGMIFVGTSRADLLAYPAMYVEDVPVPADMAEALEATQQRADGSVRERRQSHERRDAAPLSAAVVSGL